MKFKCKELLLSVGTRPPGGVLRQLPHFAYHSCKTDVSHTSLVSPVIPMCIWRIRRLFLQSWVPLAWVNVWLCRPWFNAVLVTAAVLTDINFSLCAYDFAPTYIHANTRISTTCSLEKDVHVIAFRLSSDFAVVAVKALQNVVQSCMAEVCQIASFEPHEDELCCSFFPGECCGNIV